ncbi:hypothetical protein WR25_13529 [Diploscapter pachys]|uniref:Uncharacterized protein n=1 Tax=Diploscapter pachys TaxID=2018661 RepID=A0A2A2JCS2_9BILA|nr:hypothetical protein WR25_13529 [Diploscapter pachys]
MTPMSISVVLIDRIRIFGEQCKARGAKLLTDLSENTAHRNHTVHEKSPNEIKRHRRKPHRPKNGHSQKMTRHSAENFAAIPALMNKSTPTKRPFKTTTKPTLPTMKNDEDITNPLMATTVTWDSPKPLISTGMHGARELKSNDRFRKLASLPSTKEKMKFSEKNRPLPRPSQSPTLKSNEVVHAASQFDTTVTIERKTTSPPKARPKLQPYVGPDLPPSQNWKPIGEMLRPPEHISKAVNQLNPLNDLLGADMVNFLDPNYVTKDDGENEEEDKGQINKDTVDTDYPTSVSISTSPTIVHPTRATTSPPKIEGPFSSPHSDVRPVEVAIKRGRAGASKLIRSRKITTKSREEGWTERTAATKKAPAILLGADSSDNPNIIRIPLGNETLAMTRQPLTISPNPAIFLHQNLHFPATTDCSTVGGCLFERSLCGWTSPSNIPSALQFKKNSVHLSNFIQARVPPGEISIVQHETFMTEPHTVLFDSLEFRLGTRLVGCCYISHTEMTCPFATLSGKIFNWLPTF